MREIKYRAWVKDSDYEVLVDVLNVNVETETVTLPIETPVTKNHPYWWYNSDWSFEDVELMQFTGLKDVNGVEIYEGDIDCDDNGFKSVVCYLERYGAYCFVPLDLYKYEDYAEKVNLQYGTDCYFDNVIPSRYSNIIGNIYENPEILGVSSNV